MGLCADMHKMRKQIFGQQLIACQRMTANVSVSPPEVLKSVGRSAPDIAALHLDEAVSAAGGTLIRSIWVFLALRRFAAKGPASFSAIIELTTAPATLGYGDATSVASSCPSAVQSKCLSE